MGNTLQDYTFKRPQMGNFLLTIGILLGGASVGNAQTEPTTYYADAVQLAARAAQDLNESAQISLDMVAELTIALEAIANSGLVTAELVTKELNIHAFTYANTNSVQVYADVNAPWVQKLLDDKNNLDKSPLKTFVQFHDLTLSHIKNLDGIMMLTLQSKAPKNMKYIANDISFLDDVIMVELPAKNGDGHDIKAKRISGGWIISYIYKYEDCLSGCKKQCEWQFGVDYNNHVQFLGLYGQIPDKINSTPVVVMQNNN